MNLALIDVSDLFLWTAGVFVTLLGLTYGSELISSIMVEWRDREERARRERERDRHHEARRSYDETIGGAIRTAKRVVVRANEEFAIKAHLSSRGQTCPLCRDDVAVEEEILCGGCSASFHNECLEEMGRSTCTTMGCRKTLRVRA